MLLWKILILRWIASTVAYNRAGYDDRVSNSGASQNMGLNSGKNSWQQWLDAWVRPLKETDTTHARMDSKMRRPELNATDHSGVVKNRLPQEDYDLFSPEAEAAPANHMNNDTQGRITSQNQLFNAIAKRDTSNANATKDAFEPWDYEKFQPQDAAPEPSYNGANGAATKRTPQSGIDYSEFEGLAPIPEEISFPKISSSKTETSSSTTSSKPSTAKTTAPREISSPAPQSIAVQSTLSLAITATVKQSLINTTPTTSSAMITAEHLTSAKANPTSARTNTGKEATTKPERSHTTSVTSNPTESSTAVRSAAPSSTTTVKLSRPPDLQPTDHNYDDYDPEAEPVPTPRSSTDVQSNQSAKTNSPANKPTNASLTTESRPLTITEASTAQTPTASIREAARTTTRKIEPSATSTTTNNSQKGVNSTWESTGRTVKSSQHPDHSVTNHNYDEYDPEAEPGAIPQSSTKVQAGRTDKAVSPTNRPVSVSSTPAPQHTETSTPQQPSVNGQKTERPPIVIYPPSPEPESQIKDTAETRASAVTSTTQQSATASTTKSVPRQESTSVAGGSGTREVTRSAMNTTATANAPTEMPTRSATEASTASESRSSLESSQAPATPSINHNYDDYDPEAEPGAIPQSSTKVPTGHTDKVVSSTNRPTSVSPTPAPPSTQTFVRQQTAATQQKTENPPIIINPPSPVPESQVNDTVETRAGTPQSGTVSNTRSAPHQESTLATGSSGTRDLTLSGFNTSTTASANASTIMPTMLINVMSTASESRSTLKSSQASITPSINHNYDDYDPEAEPGVILQSSTKEQPKQTDKAASSTNQPANASSTQAPQHTQTSTQQRTTVSEQNTERPPIVIYPPSPEPESQIKDTAQTRASAVTSTTQQSATASTTKSVPRQESTSAVGGSGTREQTSSAINTATTASANAPTEMSTRSATALSTASNSRSTMKSSQAPATPMINHNYDDYDPEAEPGAIPKSSTKVQAGQTDKTVPPTNQPASASPTQGAGLSTNAKPSEAVQTAVTSFGPARATTRNAEHDQSSTTSISEKTQSNAPSPPTTKSSASSSKVTESVTRYNTETPNRQHTQTSTRQQTTVGEQETERPPIIIYPPSPVPESQIKDTAETRASAVTGTTQQSGTASTTKGVPRQESTSASGGSGTREVTRSAMNTTASANAPTEMTTRSATAASTASESRSSLKSSQAPTTPLINHNYDDYDPEAEPGAIPQSSTKMQQGQTDKTVLPTNGPTSASPTPDRQHTQTSTRQQTTVNEQRSEHTPTIIYPPSHVPENQITNTAETRTSVNAGTTQQSVTVSTTTSVPRQESTSASGGSGTRDLTRSATNTPTTESANVPTARSAPAASTASEVRSSLKSSQAPATPLINHNYDDYDPEAEPGAIPQSSTKVQGTTQYAEHNQASTTTSSEKTQSNTPSTATAKYSASSNQVTEAVSRHNTETPDRQHTQTSARQQTTVTEQKTEQPPIIIYPPSPVPESQIKDTAETRASAVSRTTPQSGTASNTRSAPREESTLTAGGSGTPEPTRSAMSTATTVSANAPTELPTKSTTTLSTASESRSSMKSSHAPATPLINHNYDDYDPEAEPGVIPKSSTKVEPEQTSKAVSSSNRPVSVSPTPDRQHTQTSTQQQTAVNQQKTERPPIIIYPASPEPESQIKDTVETRISPFTSTTQQSGTVSNTKSVSRQESTTTAGGSGTPEPTRSAMSTATTVSANAPTELPTKSATTLSTASESRSSMKSSHAPATPLIDHNYDDYDPEAEPGAIPQSSTQGQPGQTDKAVSSTNRPAPVSPTHGSGSSTNAQASETVHTAVSTSGAVQKTTRNAEHKETSTTGSSERTQSNTPSTATAKYSASSSQVTESMTRNNTETPDRQHTQTSARQQTTITEQKTEQPPIIIYPPSPVPESQIKNTSESVANATNGTTSQGSTASNTRSVPHQESTPASVVGETRDLTRSAMNTASTASANAATEMPTRSSSAVSTTSESRSSLKSSQVPDRPLTNHNYDDYDPEAEPGTILGSSTKVHTGNSASPTNPTENLSSTQRSGASTNTEASHAVNLTTPKSVQTGTQKTETNQGDRNSVTYATETSTAATSKPGWTTGRSTGNAQVTSAAVNSSNVSEQTSITNSFPRSSSVSASTVKPTSASSVPQSGATMPKSSQAPDLKPNDHNYEDYDPEAEPGAMPRSSTQAQTVQTGNNTASSTNQPTNVSPTQGSWSSTNAKTSQALNATTRGSDSVQTTTQTNTEAQTSHTSTTTSSKSIQSSSEKNSTFTTTRMESGNLTVMPHKGTSDHTTSSSVRGLASSSAIVSKASSLSDTTLQFKNETNTTNSPRVNTPAAVGNSNASNLPSVATASAPVTSSNIPTARSTISATPVSAAKHTDQTILMSTQKPNLTAIEHNYEDYDPEAEPHPLPQSSTVGHSAQTAKSPPSTNRPASASPTDGPQSSTNPTTSHTARSTESGTASNTRSAPLQESTSAAGGSGTRDQTSSAMNTATTASSNAPTEMPTRSATALSTASESRSSLKSSQAPATPLINHNYDDYDPEAEPGAIPQSSTKVPPGQTDKTVSSTNRSTSASPTPDRQHTQTSTRQQTIVSEQRTERTPIIINPPQPVPESQINGTAETRTSANTGTTQQSGTASTTKSVTGQESTPASGGTGTRVLTSSAMNTATTASSNAPIEMPTRSATALSTASESRSSLKSSQAPATPLINHNYDDYDPEAEPGAIPQSSTKVPPGQTDKTVSSTNRPTGISPTHGSGSSTSARASETVHSAVTSPDVVQTTTRNAENNQASTTSTSERTQSNTPSTATAKYSASSNQVTEAVSRHNTETPDRQHTQTSARQQTTVTEQKTEQPPIIIYPPSPEPESQIKDTAETRASAVTRTTPQSSTASNTRSAPREESTLAAGGSETRDLTRSAMSTATTVLANAPAEMPTRPASAASTASESRSSLNSSQGPVTPLVNHNYDDYDPEAEPGAIPLSSTKVQPEHTDKAASTTNRQTHSTAQMPKGSTSATSESQSTRAASSTMTLREDTSAANGGGLASNPSSRSTISATGDTRNAFTARSTESVTLVVIPKQTDRTTMKSSQPSDLPPIEHNYEDYDPEAEPGAILTSTIKVQSGQTRQGISSTNPLVTVSSTHGSRPLTNVEASNAVNSTAPSSRAIQTTTPKIDPGAASRTGASEMTQTKTTTAAAETNGAPSNQVTQSVTRLNPETPNRQSISPNTDAVQPTTSKREPNLTQVNTATQASGSSTMTKSATTKPTGVATEASRTAQSSSSTQKSSQVPEPLTNHNYEDYEPEAEPGVPQTIKPEFTPQAVSKATTTSFPRAQTDATSEEFVNRSRSTVRTETALPVDREIEEKTKVPAVINVMPTTKDNENVPEPTVINSVQPESSSTTLSEDFTQETTQVTDSDVVTASTLSGTGNTIDDSSQSKGRTGITLSQGAQGSSYSGVPTNTKSGPLEHSVSHSTATMSSGGVSAGVTSVITISSRLTTNTEPKLNFTRSISNAPWSKVNRTDGQTTECSMCLLCSKCHRCSDCVSFGNSTYTCNCWSGFLGDGYKCIEDQCVTKKKQCGSDSQCVSSWWYAGKNMEIRAGFQCKCDPGYVMNNEEECVPDLCSLKEDGCPSFSTCVASTESKTGHKCVCTEGYWGDGSFCVPDPCLVRENSCMEHEYCLTTDSTSYTCECKAGYYKKNGACVPDRCTDGTHGCSENSDCDSCNSGHYQCVCHEGFYMSGTTCLEHPCHRNSTPCHEKARCFADVDQYGQLTAGFQCRCHVGYYANGSQCVPDQCYASQPLCTEPRQKCHSFRNGSYECRCEDGYVLNNGRCEIHPCYADRPICAEEHAWCVPQLDAEGRLSSMYTCHCAPPYVSNGSECYFSPRDGCTADEYMCPSNGKCVPNAQLLDGIKDCVQAEDENPLLHDECALNRQKCDKQNAECTNLARGRYACACKASFVGDGVFCEPLDSFFNTSLLYGGEETTLSPEILARKVKPQLIYSSVNTSEDVSDIEEDEKPNALGIQCIREQVKQIQRRTRRDTTTPICRCPPGQMPDVVSGNCTMSSIGTLQLHVKKLCNYTAVFDRTLSSSKTAEFNEMASALFWGLTDALDKGGPMTYEKLGHICIPPHPMQGGSIVFMSSIECSSGSCSLDDLISALNSSDALLTFDPTGTTVTNCQPGVHDCDPHATCVSNGFSYNCVCKSGYDDQSPSHLFPGRYCIRSNEVQSSSTCLSVGNGCIPLYLVLIIIGLSVLVVCLFILWCLYMNKWKGQRENRLVYPVHMPGVMPVMVHPIDRGVSYPVSYPSREELYQSPPPMHAHPGAYGLPIRPWSRDQGNIPTVFDNDNLTSEGLSYPITHASPRQPATQQRRPQPQRLNPEDNFVHPNTPMPLTDRTEPELANLMSTRSV